MTDDAENLDRKTLLSRAEDPATTPFDYVIVGSGAGGGPLAARLALNGRRVLLIEAGVDPATGLAPVDPEDAPDEEETIRQVYAVPAFHAAATEDPEMSWTFSVRHYTDDARQAADSKYTRAQDPWATDGGAARGGIQYPRAAAIGGCTAHYAMIIIRPNDTDWDQIAAYTNDDSWRSENMQGYFAKIEKCLYYAVYRGFGGNLLRWARKIAIRLDPRGQLNPGGHGFKGWQPTSFINPLVIASIVRGDRTFLRVLLSVAFSALAKRNQRSAFVEALLGLQGLQFLDPNVRSPIIPNRDHLSLISIGTDGSRRFGLSDHLNDVAKHYPNRLVIHAPFHATRVLFEPGDKAPRAIGVELWAGAHLYGASPLATQRAGTPACTKVYARREVIVCGGAFNTPQMLMLSGIGDRDHLRAMNVDGPRDAEGRVIAPIVHLPGVGRNLQDRYEVSVMTEAKQDFSTLNEASFTPDDAKDPVLKKWVADKSGLYATNGGAIAMMLSSESNAQIRDEPDLFIFGVSAAFRGYYWNWSKELLSKLQGAPPNSRNLWSWVILKAYTNNDRGRVSLRSNDPLEQPQIDFHSFDDPPEGDTRWKDDVEALCDAIKAVREINKSISVFSEKEIQPGVGLADKTPDLREWIKNEAWGHHACGTCRIGSDRWVANPAKLSEPDAVLDSSFRVHGVENLRVVDTSVFPHIPGYFIAAPTFMIGEKAADLLLADTADYPRLLEQKEADAVRARRNEAHAGAQPPGADRTKLPADTIGIALSGGGIRSATFSLGVLQALAKCGRLRDIDIVSSVSGGGYAASFLGRLFTQQPDFVPDKTARVQSILADPASAEIGWLRRHAQYIEGGGRRDTLFDIAVVLRNLASVYLWIGTLLFAAFGLVHWLALCCPRIAAGPVPRGIAPPEIFGAKLSPWWWLPIAVFVLGVLPSAIGYWLAFRDNPSRNPRAWLPFLLWLVLLGCAIYGLSVPALANWSVAVIGVLLLSWIVQAVAGWRVPAERQSRKWGKRVEADTTRPTASHTVVRNRLTRLLGVSLFGFLVAALWVVLDTAARLVYTHELPKIGWSAMAVAPLLPLLRGFAVNLLKGKPKPGAAPATALWLQILLGVLAFALVFVLLLYLDTFVYYVFGQGVDVGQWCVVTALLASAVVGRTLAFVNLSSLQQAFSQKLVRTFLGASNNARVHPAGTDTPVPVNVSDLGDDIDFDTYHPEKHGGPLHLVNTCVNNTVDPLSGNQLHDDKGMPMCAGPAGISVGRRFHALWGERTAAMPTRLAPVEAVRVEPDPHEFHVLARADDGPVMVERLRLGQWIAISGAAYTTGAGRSTRLAQSLLLGLLNVRIGYWWNSGIPGGRRPGRYPPGPWRWLKSLPSTLFTLQATLLDEWRAYFPGPAERLWYLSDGGHFDNTALYELIRRRLPVMIAVDATSDPDYLFDDLALLTRQVRLDFCASLDWLDPTAARARAPRPASGWAAFNGPISGQTNGTPPDWLTRYVCADRIGKFADLRRDGPHSAALARITYADEPDRTSWLLLIKPCLLPDLPNDLRTYAALHETYPNQTTLDQFFDDNQWEAYRMLGQCAAAKLFR